MIVQIVDSHVRGAAELGYGLTAGEVGVATIAPQIQIVTIGCQQGLLKRSICARKDKLLTALQACLTDRVLNFDLPFPDNNAAVGLLIHRKAIIALFLNLHTGTGQVHEVAGRVVDSENEVSELQLDITTPARYVTEENIRIPSQPQEVALTQFHFHTGIGLRNNSVAAQQRQIDGHFRPVHIACRLVACFPVNKADSGRVVALAKQRRCQNEGNRCGRKQSQHIDG